MVAGARCRIFHGMSSCAAIPLSFPRRCTVLAAALLVACGRAAFDPEPVPEKTAGASQSLTDKDFGQQRVTRVEELFAGRFPGVEVFNAPGGIQVRIRGQTTLFGESEPLFVVAGTPLLSGTGGLLAINPHEVARIEVLKDAASTSAYGLRGANGVIKVTTKR
jgi:TonB-dependent SusC/RagA subfamily outer membrane receptor